MPSTISLDLYLDYLLHKEALRNLFTLYYCRDATVGTQTRCFTPLPMRMGWVEVSPEDVDIMGFFDWVGVIVRCALYLREEVPARVVVFLAKAPRDEMRLQKAIDIELNEKAKQEALVSREACITDLLAWDKKSLATALAIREQEVPDTFEALYELLEEHADDEQGDEDKGPGDVMMPMGLPVEGGMSGLSVNGDSQEDGIDLSSSMSEQTEGGLAENRDSESDQSDSGMDSLEDDNLKNDFEALSSLTDDNAVHVADEGNDAVDVSGYGFSLSGGGEKATFVKNTDTPLEALVEMLIKTAKGEEGREKGRRKVRWKTHWSGYHRQFAHVQEMLGDNVILPPRRRQKDPPRGKGKFKLCVYLDTSYSCQKEAERFFSLVTNMSTKRFEIALHSFSDRVKTHDIEKGKFDYQLGGTHIESVVKHAREIDAETSFDAVVVLTDGDFSSVRHDKHIRLPEKWHWVITGKRDYQTMPLASHYYTLPPT